MPNNLCSNITCPLYENMPTWCYKGKGYSTTHTDYYGVTSEQEDKWTPETPCCNSKGCTNGNPNIQSATHPSTQTHPNVQYLPPRSQQNIQSATHPSTQTHPNVQYLPTRSQQNIQYASPPSLSNIYGEEENISNVTPEDQAILNSYNMIYIGCLNPNFTRTEQQFFPLHPKSKAGQISLSNAINTMKGLNSTNNNMYDILIYNPSSKIGYAGEIDTSLLKEDMNDFSNIRTPTSDHFSSIFLTKTAQCTKNSYQIYVRSSDQGNWHKLINDLLNKKINSVSNNKNSATTEYQNLLCQKKVNNNPNLSLSDCMNAQQEDQMYNQMQNQPYNQQNNQEQIKEQLNSYKTAEVSNLNAIHTLKQMDINENQLLEKNYENINGINEKILTTTERINTLKSRYSFNTKVIKHLKTALLIIFILTLFAMGFYGIRDNYTTKSKSK